MNHYPLIRFFSELWKFRLLVWALVVRQLRSRYRGSVLGYLWSFLNPLMMIVIYSLVFQSYVRFDHVQNYSLFLLAGLLPWIWFSSGILESTSAIVAGGHLITKAMFPPQVLPVVSILTNGIHFLLALPVLLVALVVTGTQFHWTIIFLPLFVFIQLIFMTGISLGTSALNVRFRDVQHIIGHIMSLWFFLCPIVYPRENIPNAFAWTVLFNPIAVIVDGYHRIFLLGVPPELIEVICAISLSFIFLIIGIIIFEGTREEFSELV
jgi:lipopolysaccharide transport system permease protein